MMVLDKKLHTQKKYKITTACVVILVHFADFALCFLIRGCRNDFPIFTTIYHLSLVCLGWPHLVQITSGLLTYLACVLVLCFQTKVNVLSHSYFFTSLTQNRNCGMGLQILLL